MRWKCPKGWELGVRWRRINIPCANNSTLQERPNCIKSMISGNEKRPGMIHVLYNVEMMAGACWWWQHTSKVISSKVSLTARPHKNCPTPGYWWNHPSQYLLHNWDWNHYTRWLGCLVSYFVKLTNQTSNIVRVRGIMSCVSIMLNVNTLRNDKFWVIPMFTNFVVVHFIARQSCFTDFKMASCLRFQSNMKPHIILLVWFGNI